VGEEWLEPRLTHPTITHDHQFPPNNLHYLNSDEKTRIRYKKRIKVACYGKIARFVFGRTPSQWFTHSNRRPSDTGGILLWRVSGVITLVRSKKRDNRNWRCTSWHPAIAGLVSDLGHFKMRTSDIDKGAESNVSQKGNLWSTTIHGKFLETMETLYDERKDEVFSHARPEPSGAYEPKLSISI
jgi:hypothetical protein